MYWATICAESTGIRCRRRHYILLGHNMCREYRHQMSPATLHPIGPQYVSRVPASDVAGDITSYWATICVESTGIRCRRRHYILLGHNMCRVYRHQMSPATLHAIGPQYVPRVPASDVASDITSYWATICAESTSIRCRRQQYV